MSPVDISPCTKDLQKIRFYPEHLVRWDSLGRVGWNRGDSIDRCCPWRHWHYVGRGWHLWPGWSGRYSTATSTAGCFCRNLTEGACSNHNRHCRNRYQRCSLSSASSLTPTFRSASGSALCLCYWFQNRQRKWKNICQFVLIEAQIWSWRQFVGMAQWGILKRNFSCDRIWGCGWWCIGSKLPPVGFFLCYSSQMLENKGPENKKYSVVSFTMKRLQK